jgi:beta-lactamase class A
LPPDWSPLRDRYPDGTDSVSLAGLLGYTVSQSDNNGCDILFRMAGGPGKVDSFIHQNGINDIAIAATEAEMHKAWDVQFSNWSTPIAMVKLLHKFADKDILSLQSTSFLMKLMEETTTGPQKIKGQLPKGVVVSHKTGSSGTNEKGITAATNDVGIVFLPDGRKYAIAIFVSNTSVSSEASDKVIAAISKEVWDYFSRK